MSPLERARAALGVRFRLHGRSVADGLDCVGLAALAYGIEAPRGYAPRSGDAARVAALVAAAGLTPAEDRRAGDMVLLQAGPGQLHLGIDSGNGLIHADAMLRRVVERPGDMPWPVIGRWRG